jgi:hypothetical protein
MTAPARIVTAVLALGALLGVSYAVGTALGPLDRGGSGVAHADGGHGDAAEVASPADGLAVAANGLRLHAAATDLPADRVVPFSFRILGRDNAPVRDFDVLHEKRMHLIVTSRDLAEFQHVHPTLGADGTWRADLSALRPGAYRAFADFSTGGRPSTLGVDLTVPGRATPKPLPAARHDVRSGDVTFSLHPNPIVVGREASLEFEVTRGGTPVPVGRYLGARGHLVILREGDLAYLHTHADDDALRFSTTFQSAGRYRAFLQVLVDGAVRTAAFTVEIT